MKLLIFLIVILAACAAGAYAQHEHDSKAQQFAAAKMHAAEVAAQKKAIAERAKESDLFDHYQPNFINN